MKIYKASDLFLEAKTICSLFYFSFHKGDIGKNCSQISDLQRLGNLGYIWVFARVRFSILGSFRQFWGAAGWSRGSWGRICPLWHRGKGGTTAGAGRQAHVHTYGNTQPYRFGLGWNVTCLAKPPERQPFMLIRIYFDFLQHVQITFLHRTKSSTSDTYVILKLCFSMIAGWGFFHSYQLLLFL